MRELIGLCHNCRKEVYCVNGFFDGVQEDGVLSCRSCSDVWSESSEETE
ncbi:hypothetical protein [Oceanobacillus halophilus]|nr:hypothetical protein [Oceanobacillus halophilus]